MKTSMGLSDAMFNTKERCYKEEFKQIDKSEDRQTKHQMQ